MPVLYCYCPAAASVTRLWEGPFVSSHGVSNRRAKVTFCAYLDAELVGITANRRIATSGSKAWKTQAGGARNRPVT